MVSSGQWMRVVFCRMWGFLHMGHHRDQSFIRCGPLSSLDFTSVPRKLRAPIKSSSNPFAPNLLSMKIVSEQSIIRIEKNFMWTKLRTNLEVSFPGDTEKLLSRSRVFSTGLYLVRTKNIKQVRVRFLQGLKKKPKPKQQWSSMYTVSQHGLDT